MPATANSELQVEHLPLFTTSRYEIRHLPGPISAGATITVPTSEELDPGSYVVRVTCMQETRPLAEFQLTVRFVLAPAEPTGTPSRALPKTG